MDVAVDISDLCTNRADGTTRYTRELAVQLPTYTSNINWMFVAPCKRETTASRIPRHMAKPSPKGSNITYVSSTWPKFWTQTRLPYDLYRLRPDVLFMPIQQLPIFRPRTMKTVATVHDLAIHIFPDQFTYKDWFLLQVFSAQVAQEADHIIAVSKSTADDIEKYYGRTNNVHIIPHGVDHSRFYPPDPGDREESWSRIQKKYPSIKRPYILYVGQIQPRKNLIRLVESFELLKEDIKELNLVIAGGCGWLEKPIERKVMNSKHARSIHMIGEVPDTILPELYSNAELFTLVSLYEGFGMPILEAMACGCPVVTSNISSMPEVAGDAALLVDPNDTQSIAHGIQQAMKDRDALAQKGIERAKYFTWEKTVLSTLNVISNA